MASAATFRHRVLVGMRRAPLHARSAATAQAILGPACAEVDVVRPSDVPDDDDREFFITAWYADPRFIPDGQVLFIPEPRVLSPEEAARSMLSGFRYFVRLRLIAHQDWNTPPASPADDGGDGGDDDDAGDGPDGRHDSADGRGGQSRETPEDFSGGRDSDDDGSLDNNCNHFHPGTNSRRRPCSSAQFLARWSMAGGATRQLVAIGGPSTIPDA